MAAKRGKRKASASPENGGLAGSSGSTTTMVWTMEDAKKALLKVKVTEADEQGVRKVGKNSLAEAIHGSATPGKVGWSNVMRRGCALPLPESSKFQLEGSKQTADVFHPSDVPGVVRKLLGLQGGLAWFQNTSFVSGVKTLMTTCGWSDFSKLEAVLEAVQVQVRQREAELAAFEVPALSDGSTRMRLHTNARGRVLISAHDELKWLGLDDDGKHNEWTHWLCSALEDYIKGYHHSSDSRSDDTPCLEYVKLDSESIHTPIIDKKCFQKVIWLFIGKSKLAGEHAEKALDIYGRHIVGDSRLDEERAANAAAAPKEAKDFVLGPEEATRQESLRSGAPEEALQQMMQLMVQQTVQQTLAAAVERMTPVQINVNKTPRSNEDLRRINLPAPVTTEEGEALGKRTLFVTDFLRKYLPEVIPGIDAAGSLLQQLVTAVRGKFGESLQNAKLERGPLFRCGQLGRSQPHYEVEDEDLMKEVATGMHGFFLSNFKRIGHANQYHGEVFPQLLEQATKRRRVGFEVEERQPVGFEVEERQPVLLGQYPPSNIGCLIDPHRELSRRGLPDYLLSPLLKTMVYFARRLFPFYEPKTKLIIHQTGAPTRMEFTWYFYKHHEAVLEPALMDVCRRYLIVFIARDPISCAVEKGKASVMEPCYCPACSKRRLRDRKTIPSSEFVESKERTETKGRILVRRPKGPMQQ